MIETYWLGSNNPAALKTAADSSAACFSGGHMEGVRCASMDVPVPDGPTINKARAPTDGAGATGSPWARLAQISDNERTVLSRTPPRDHGSFACTGFGQNQGARRIGHAALRQCPGKRTADRTQLSGQHMLAREFIVVEALGRDLPTGRQEAQCNGKIEARGIAWKIGRRQMGGDPAHRVFKIGIEPGRADPVLGFADFGFGPADYGQRGADHWPVAPRPRPRALRT